MSIGIFATNQITVSSTAVLLLPGNLARGQAQLYNGSGSTIYIGQTAGVTTTTGYAVPTGFPFEISPYKGDVYGIAASGNLLIPVLETNG